MKRYPHSRSLRASSISLAIAGMLIAGAAQAGQIADSNPTPSATFAGECGTAGAPEACVGAWNLGNVEVQQVREDGSTFGSFDEATGAYAAMGIGDSFVSVVRGAMDAVMARITGKVWPVGEPTAIKAVNGDSRTNNGKPENCLINSSYLGADDSTSGLDAYLDSASPEPVICSSGFQSHKRFKIAMQPATVATAANGDAGEAIDLVFNVSDNSALTPYQVFSKINNYTDKRLKGYRIVVGRGTGSGFQSASALNITDRLHISLGIGEGWSSGQMGAPDGSDLFDGDGLATFSQGLFGLADPPRFPSNGFFDDQPAGFDVVQACDVAPNCTAVPNPAFPAVNLFQSDTIESTTVLTSNYTTLFGDWLPSRWQPSGVFHDDDNDPNTDPVLMAWWNGSAWVGNNDSGFAPIPAAQLEAWGSDPLYEVATIEDVLNLGINYIVKVGDDLDNDATTTTSTFTIRIIPVVADDQSEPTFLAAAPAPLTPVTPPPVTTSSGGGCSMAAGQQPVDPVLPLVAGLGLLGWGLRRARRR